MDLRPRLAKTRNHNQLAVQQALNGEIKGESRRVIFERLTVGHGLVVDGTKPSRDVVFGLVIQPLVACMAYR
jgi:hypothetical protein